MAGKKTYLITKLHEPEGDYAASLVQLPGDEDDLTTELPVIIKRREMTEDEAAMVNARQHVEQVVEDADVYADEEIPDEEIGTDARIASMDAVSKYHGFDKAHASGYRAQERKIAVIDTGLSPTRERSIANRLFARRSFVPGEGHEDTHSGHGTHVMGTVVHNAPGAAYGVYKNLSTKDGSGKMSYGIEAMNQAVKDGATDINCSYGGEGGPDSPASKAADAARSKGVRVNVASGNEQRGKTSMTSENRSPASSVRACTVGCGDIDGNLSDFSSWGNNVDIRAVGEAQESWGIGAGMAAMSGTSMSCPVVTAAGAVCGSHGATADEIDKALYSTTGDTRYSPAQEGFGVLDVEFAVKRLTRRASRPEKPKQPAPPSPAGLFSHPSLREEEG
jgi:subtilisin family serine protease